MKAAINKAIYYSQHPIEYNLITTIYYTDLSELSTILKNLRKDLSIRDFFTHDNVLYDICSNIDFNDISMEQLDGLLIVTRRDMAIKIIRKELVNNNFGIIKIDSVLAEIKIKSWFRWVLCPVLVAVGVGMYHGYLSLKKD